MGTPANVNKYFDVAAYTKAAEAIELKAEKKGRGLVITPEMPSDELLKDVLLTMEVAAEGITATQDGQKLETTTRDGKSYFSFNPYGGKIILK